MKQPDRRSYSNLAFAIVVLALFAGIGAGQWGHASIVNADSALPARGQSAALAAARSTVLAAAQGATPAPAPAKAQDWEPTIRKFEEADRANPPKRDSIVFTGSSSIVKWNTLAEDMKPLEVVNRAFGGSQYTDVDQYAGRIVVAYHPRAVIVYAGDNDLAANSPKTAESVANDFKQFVQIVRGGSPETFIYVMSIKPSKLRWNEWPKMQAANKLIQDFVRTQKRVEYIDVTTPMFDAQGNLPADLFVADGLHPTPKLYALWTSIIRPKLLERFGPGTKVSGLRWVAPVVSVDAARWAAGG
jgi:lysophospholipase L1-like esterase